jgi:phenylalanyl-tRNA synthetase beta chain
MKVSRNWLQNFFETELPASEVLADALTFHSSEVEEVEGDQLDVKVLPDRAPYALSHRGIAYELAAALPLPMKNDPLRAELPERSSTNELTVQIENNENCLRYIGAFVKGVKVGPSPEWLKQALESVGQRSINNVVDATNYVMLNIGQPLHAFDAGKLKKSETNGAIGILVRGAYEGEKITTLSGDELMLPEDTLVIADANADVALGIAGVKGGKAAELTDATTDILVEAANFEGASIRRASQLLKLWTDASLRFQNKISPELAAYGMRDVLALIQQVAGGEVVGVVDAYPAPAQPAPMVTITLDRINSTLGSSYSVADVQDAFARLSLSFTADGETFHLLPSFERRDLSIPEDVIEEVGRILGYDGIPSTELPAMQETPDQKRFHGIERLKDFLTERGYTEISTQSFAAKGDITLANPLQSDRPALRAGLAENMTDALARAASVAPRTLGVAPMLKLFELGTVFTKDGEHLSLCLGYQQLIGKASSAVLEETVTDLLETFAASGIARPANIDATVCELSLRDVNLESIGEGYEPTKIALGSFVPFSNYPSAIRDIAVWTPEGTEESEVSLAIQKEAGPLLARMDLFDRFEKTDAEGTTRTSYAFRLVFQANDRTLSDVDLDPTMATVTNALNTHEGWQVR